MESKEFDFGVVVCCYNPDFEKLKKTIISIVNQKDVSFEIIISDDGSKENYLEKLKEWVNKNNIENIRYNFLKENVGTVKNLISGIELSSAKYIKDISPGDYFFDESSLKRYKIEFEEKGLDAVYARAVYYNDEGKIFKITTPQLKSSENNKNLKRNICIYRDYLLGATQAFKREMIEFFYEIKDVVRLLEDYPFTYLLLINNKKIGVIDECLLWYEYGTGVSTGSNAQILDIDRVNFYNYLEKEYKDNKYVQKSVKFNRLFQSTKKNYIKAHIVKPTYLLMRIHRKLYNKLRKYKKVDYEMIQKITTL